MTKQDVIEVLAELGVEITGGKVCKADLDRALGLHPVEAVVSKKELEDALNSTSNDFNSALLRLLNLMSEGDTEGKILTVAKEGEIYGDLDALMAKLRPMVEEISKTCEAGLVEAAGTDRR